MPRPPATLLPIAAALLSLVARSLEEPGLAQPQWQPLAPAPGSDAASPFGINVVLNYCKAYSSFGVRCAVAPHVPNNAGSLGPITISAPVAQGGAQNYGSAFLPASYQGTRLEELTARNPALTLELVRAYYRISDPSVRKRVFDLIKAMTPTD
jgi:hypothetical protein